MASSKEQVKSILQQNKKTFLSGEEIADRLGLSRNAVWKAVKSLRAEGYAIDAETRKGYCLLAEPDLLDEEKIRKCLEGSSITTPSSFHIKVYPEIDSTNQEGKRLAIAGAESGTVILADQQTAGRGRRSNAFASPAGGLYFSLLLRPEMENLTGFMQTPISMKSTSEKHLKGEAGQIEVAGQMVETSRIKEAGQMGETSRINEANQIIAPTLSTTDPKEIMNRSLEAACACVDRVTGKKISYEANDLYLDGRKVGGILTESGYEFESGFLQWVVIGVGLNVKTDLSKLPEETRSRAGSLYPAEDDHSLKNELAAGLIIEFARRLIV
ncbi:MAG: HTH domain-containing protein [Lachnospiraceae bacterium]|nr:HTH domain-containing protein [Lachnospiraceae bacterium]